MKYNVAQETTDSGIWCVGTLLTLSAVCHVGAASSGAGPSVGGACVPLRQVRGVRQCCSDDDESPDRRLAREPVQGQRSLVVMPK